MLHFELEPGLLRVVMEACVYWAFTYEVGDLVKPIGAGTDISKSEVSRIFNGLDADMAKFRDRTRASQNFTFVFLDATYCKARVRLRIVCQAIVDPTGVAAAVRREAIGAAAGHPERPFYNRAPAITEDPPSQMGQACPVRRALQVEAGNQGHVPWSQPHRSRLHLRKFPPNHKWFSHRTQLPAVKGTRIPIEARQKEFVPLRANWLMGDQKKKREAAWSSQKFQVWSHTPSPFSPNS